MVQLVILTSDSHTLKRGHVVTILPDTADAGRKVYGNPLFRVVQVPGMSMEQAAVFTEQERDEKTSRLVRHRKRKLDFNKLGAADRAEIEAIDRNFGTSPLMDAKKLSGALVEEVRLGDLDNR